MGATSSARIWRWSGRGWTVMPCAPASRAIVERRSRLGIPIVRVFRSVAILFTFTDSRVTGVLRSMVARSVDVFLCLFFVLWIAVLVGDKDPVFIECICGNGPLLEWPPFGRSEQNQGSPLVVLVLGGQNRQCLFVQRGLHEWISLAYRSEDSSEQSVGIDILLGN